MQKASNCFAKFPAVITLASAVILSVIWSCSRTSQNRDPKFTQYFNQGELLYEQHCSNCHQKNGKGLGRIYPPLDSSDYMIKHFEQVLCLMRNGLSGPIAVNGIEYNQPMPGVKTLTDLEVAKIATYIYNAWGNERGMVEVKEVTPVLSSCDSIR